MFWNVIDKNRQSVLGKLVDSPPVENSYLVGGTALALMIGHRESIDFDWFTPEPFTPDQIDSNLSIKGDLLISEAKKNTFHGIFNGVQITWLHYPHPLIEPLVENENPFFKMASLHDIGAMKIIAASQRGAKKDFIDLYMIEQSGLTIASIIKNLPKKFPDTSINYYHIIKSLVYFDDAEQEPMPRMLLELEWNTIKDFFIQIQKPLLDSLK
jgi:hypothetical protein